jgi:hypothetical protein
VTSIRINVDLPAPLGTEQPEDFAFLYREADAVHGGEVAELLDDAADVDGVLHVTGNSTYAVIPTARRRSLLSSRSRISKVLMSRFVRLTSRWVANAASTPR